MQIVSRALGELRPEIRIRLTQAVAGLSSAFEDLPIGSAPRPHVLRRGSVPQRTLAAGRPGAATSLGEASPGSRHPLSTSRAESAHQHSVARSDDPHGETKLSSASGLTQERESESLSKGGRSPG